MRDYRTLGKKGDGIFFFRVASDGFLFVLFVVATSNGGSNIFGGFVFILLYFFLNTKPLRLGGKMHGVAVWNLQLLSKKFLLLNNGRVYGVPAWCFLNLHFAFFFFLFLSYVRLSNIYINYHDIFLYSFNSSITLDTSLQTLSSRKSF